MVGLLITQLFLDWMVKVVGALMNLSPALPSQVEVLVGDVEGGETWLNDHLGAFGVIMPWALMEGFVAAWVSLLGFYAATKIVLLVMHLVRPGQW